MMVPTLTAHSHITLGDFLIPKPPSIQNSQALNDGEVLSLLQHPGSAVSDELVATDWVACPLFGGFRA